MTKDDVIRMAREAGAVFPADGSWHRFDTEALERFANLLAEAERELQQAYDALLLSSKPSGLTADQVRIKND